MPNRTTSLLWKGTWLGHCLAGAALSATGAAAQTGASPAGTRIENTAAMTWTVDGRGGRTTSNTVVTIVAERLDVALTPPTAIPPAAGDTTTVPVRLTNSGSGSEAFVVTATLSNGASVGSIAIDRNGDGRFDPAVDTRVDGTTPPLAPGETVTLLVLIPADADGTLTVGARATTGSGEPGRVFPGAGDGGGDAVVGQAGAAATVTIALGGTGDGGAPTLTKSQSVRAPDGSARAVSGAVVTYTLAARFAGPAEGVRIDDPIPAGAAYLPGSMTLDAAPLTDAADGDAGRFDAAAIHVELGTIAEATTRTVTFKVRLP